MILFLLVMRKKWRGYGQQYLARSVARAVRMVEVSAAYLVRLRRIVDRDPSSPYPYVGRRRGPFSLC